MKSHITRFFLILSTLSSLTAYAQAQQGSPSVAPAPSPAHNTQFRVLAEYVYSMSSPGDLNDYRSKQLWNNTTASQGTFSGMQGFTVGGGLKAGPGFLGLEYSRSFEELPNTQIGATTTYVQDTFEYESIYALYDYVIVIDQNQSLELGGGIGYAMKYQYHNFLTSNGVQEDVVWKDEPMAFKVRAYYHYHFTPNVILRAGGSYEYVTSSDMKSDANHPTVVVNGAAVINGQKLRKASGENVKVDMSGLRLSIGATFAF